MPNQHHALFTENFLLCFLMEIYLNDKISSALPRDIVQLFWDIFVVESSWDVAAHTGQGGGFCTQKPSLPSNSNLILPLNC